MKILIEYINRRSLLIIKLEHTNFNYQSLILILLLSFLQRLSFVYQIDEFLGDQYQEQLLLLIMKVTNQSTLLKVMRDCQTVIFFAFVVGILHLTFTCFILIVQEDFYIIKQCIRIYFDLLNVFILIPSLIFLCQLLSDHTAFGTIFLFILLANLCIKHYFWRNYKLMSSNILIKRYSWRNLLFSLLDFVYVIGFYTLNNTVLLDVISAIWYLLHAIELFHYHPYNVQINNIQVYLQFILLFQSLIKLILIQQEQIIISVHLLILSPLLATIGYLFQQKQFVKKITKITLTLNNTLILCELFQNKTTDPILLHHIIRNLKNVKLSILDKDDQIVNQTNRICKQLFQTMIANQQKKTNEDTYLFYSLFLLKQLKLPQLSYITIKVISMQNQISQYCYIQAQIIKQDVNQMEQLYPHFYQRTINLQKYFKSEELVEECLHIIKGILDLKISFWNKLAEGYNRIEEFSDSVIELTEEIDKISQILLINFNIDATDVTLKKNTFTLLDLRLLELIFTCIYHNPKYVQDIEESVLEAIQTQKSKFDEEQLGALQQLNDEILFLKTSLIKNKGVILNLNRSKLAKFLNVNDENEILTINNIEQIMPKFTQVFHYKVLDNYLQTGVSRIFNEFREVYSLQSQNFIKRCNLFVFHPLQYQQNDLVVIGALQVHKNQRFCLIDNTGKIVGISQDFFKILIPDQNIENKILQELIQNLYINFWFSIFQNKQIHILINQESVQSVIYPIINIQGFIREILVLNSSRKTYFSNSLHTNSEYFSNDSYLFDQPIAGVHLKHYQDSENPKYVTYKIQERQFGESIKLFVLDIIEIHDDQDFHYQSEESLEINSRFDQQQITNKNNNILNLIPQNYSFVNEQMNTQPVMLIETQIQEGQLQSSRTDQTKLIIEKLKQEDEEQIDATQKQDRRVIYQNNNIDQHAQRKGSITSLRTDRTQLSIQQQLREIQRTQCLQLGIKKSVATQILTILGGILFLITSQQIDQANNLSLQNQIQLIRIPDRFNRLYCTFLTLGQLQLQSQLLGYDISDYYLYRIKENSLLGRQELVTVIQQLKQQFSQQENSNQIELLNITIINQYETNYLEESMIFFDTMVNEHTQRINYYLQQSSNEYLYDLQITIQFLKGNLNNQVNLADNLIKNIIKDFNTKIRHHDTIQLSILLVELLFFSCMSLLNIKFQVDVLNHMKKILLFITRMHQSDIEEAILQYRFIKQKLIKNQNAWRTLDYKKKLEFFRQFSVISKYTHKRFKQQSSRIQQTEFSITTTSLIQFLFWLLLIILMLSLFVFQQIRISNLEYELNLLTDFIKFKSDFDSSMILAQLLKSQVALLENTEQSGVFSKNPDLSVNGSYFQNQYKQMLEQFVESRQNYLTTFTYLLQDIEESNSISIDIKNQLRHLFQSDLCLVQELSLPFCNYIDGVFLKFPQYPSPNEKENNRELFKFGINGVVTQIEKVFQTNYVFEIQGMKDEDIESIKAFLKSENYYKTIMPFNFDIDTTFLKFLVTVITSVTELLQNNRHQTFLLALLLGIFINMLLIIIFIFRTKYLIRTVQRIREGLILLPQEYLSQSKSQAVLKQLSEEI